MGESIQLASRSARSRPSGAYRARRLRWTAALLIAVAGALHLYLWFDYFRRVHVVGVLFLVNAAAGLLIATALVRTRDRLPLAVAAAYAAGTLAAFVVSTHWGLFGYHERFWGGWQEAAGGDELAAVILLLAGAWRSFPRAGA